VCCSAASLKRLNLPDNEQNAEAMLNVVGKAADASVAYGEFRRFVMLLPRDKLLSDTEPNVTWFECATCVPIGTLPISALVVSIRVTLVVYGM
jgi:hypothetical protein